MPDELMQKEIRGCLNQDGQLIQLPGKRKKRLIALCYVAEQIPENQTYTEKEFNALLNGLHTFGDPATLRRELFDYYLIDREKNGSGYRLSASRPSAAELIEKYGS